MSEPRTVYVLLYTEIDGSLQEVGGVCSTMEKAQKLRGKMGRHFSIYAIPFYTLAASLKSVVPRCADEAYRAR